MTNHPSFSALTPLAGSSDLLKYRLRNNINYVEWDIRPGSVNQSRNLQLLSRSDTNVISDFVVVDFPVRN